LQKEPYEKQDTQPKFFAALQKAHILRLASTGDDDPELRERILALTSSHAKQLGIGKSTLHYLRQKASGQTPFNVYAKSHRKLIHGSFLG
jgi:hypothetical protein